VVQKTGQARLTPRDPKRRGAQRGASCPAQSCVPRVAGSRIPPKSAAMMSAAPIFTNSSALWRDYDCTICAITQLPSSLNLRQATRLSWRLRVTSLKRCSLTTPTSGSTPSATLWTPSAKGVRRGVMSQTTTQTPLHLRSLGRKLLKRMVGRAGSNRRPPPCQGRLELTTQSL
jgi:hypothetical protein